MATRNFYFGKLADVVAGSAVFAAGIATDFASLGLTTAQQSAFGLLNTALQSAWTASVNPETRTPVAIEARGLALKNMRAMAVDLAKIIYATPTVTDPQLVALGLLPRAARTPSELITEMPVVTVYKVQGHNVLIRVRDASGAVRGKLPAAVGAIVYSFTGATPPSGIEGWTCEGPITKDSALIAFDDEIPVGSKVWFAAQWFNSKGVGPGSTPVCVVIGAEGSLAA
jgi:hypothetical protein